MNDVLELVVIPFQAKSTRFGVLPPPKAGHRVDLFRRAVEVTQ